MMGGATDVMVRGTDATVRYIHHNEIAHLDVSLENLLLTDDYNVKLCDFGLARRFDSEVDRIGRPTYMAPEIIDSKAQGQSYDARFADMYSLGVCLFVLFTGYRPYNSITSNAYYILRYQGVRSLLLAYDFNLRETLIRIPESYYVIIMRA